MLKKILDVISYIFTFIGISVLCWGIPLFLFGASKPAWKELLICSITCIVCFGQAWLKEKIRRQKLTVEERKKEDYEEQKRQRNIDIARRKYEFGSHKYDAWLKRQIETDIDEGNSEIDKLIYQKLDEAIEAAEDADTKIMLLKTKNDFLEEDLRKKKHR